MSAKVYHHVLSKLDVHPVLIDIGASGGPPRVWQEIAQSSIYVGVDPDLREFPALSEGRFYRTISLDVAITSKQGCDEAEFYLTRHAPCSSTLQPDVKSLSNFLFSDLFAVEAKTMVRATTLDSVVDHLSLSRVDWLKVDSQGTDLRIFQSLRTELRSRVLAIDVEPGLTDVYHGEDLFVEAHHGLIRAGFWLSSLQVGGAVRMRRSTLDEVMKVNRDIDVALVEQSVKKTPVWCEARYLRTIESLANGDCDKRDYVLLWTFALLDDQPGFALDLATEYERAFGESDVSRLMKNEPILRIRQSRRRMLFTAARSLVAVRARRWLKKLIA